MKYYIAENGQPAGPFEPNELLAHGLTVNSLVWGEGMPNWTSASQVPELMALLSGNPLDVTTTGGMPQMPPIDNQMPLPPMPDLPPVTTPQPTTPVGQNAPTPQPTNPLPFPQGSTTTQQPRQVMPKTWFIESIIATVVSCTCCFASYWGMIPGGLAIFNAWGAKTCYAKGDNAGGDKKAKSAKMWLFITLAVGVVAAICRFFQLFSDSQMMQDIQNGHFGTLYGF